MLLESLVPILEANGSCEFTGKCVDCGKNVSVLASLDAKGDVIIEGGALYEPDMSYGYPHKHVCKCDGCYKKDPKIHPRCEVYSRVVGYLRPVKQWNDGKLAEFEMREMFDIGTI